MTAQRRRRIRARWRKRHPERFKVDEAPPFPPAFPSENVSVLLAVSSGTVSVRFTVNQLTVDTPYETALATPSSFSEAPPVSPLDITSLNIALDKVAAGRRRRRAPRPMKLRTVRLMLLLVLSQMVLIEHAPKPVKEPYVRNHWRQLTNNSRARYLSSGCIYIFSLSDLHKVRGLWNAEDSDGTVKVTYVKLGNCLSDPMAQEPLHPWTAMAGGGGSPVSLFHKVSGAGQLHKLPSSSTVPLQAEKAVVPLNKKKRYPFVDYNPATGAAVASNNLAQPPLLPEKGERPKDSSPTGCNSSGGWWQYEEEICAKIAGVLRSSRAWARMAARRAAKFCRCVLSPETTNKRTSGWPDQCSVPTSACVRQGRSEGTACPHGSSCHHRQSHCTGTRVTVHDSGYNMEWELPPTVGNYQGFGENSRFRRVCLMTQIEPSIIPDGESPAPTLATPYSDDPEICLEGYIDSLNPKGPTTISGNVSKSARGWVHGFAPGRTTAMTSQMDDMVEQYRKTGFSWSLNDLGCYTGPLGPVKFPLEDEDKRFYANPRRSPYHEKLVEDEKVPPLIEAGIVVEVPANVAAAKYASNSVVAWKKDSDGVYTERRYCHNYKPINTGLLSSSARLPRIDQLLTDVSKAKFYSKADVRAGFMTLPIAEEDQPKTAFWYNRKLYMYKFMPFGLKTAPTLFQERMERAIQDAGLEHCCCVYIDDLLCYSDTWEQHLVDVEKMIKMMIGMGMKCHPEKSIFGAEIIEFLGHNLSHFGTSPTEAKIKAIKALPEPSDLHTLRRVLGFLQYYRCYCPNFSTIASVLTALTKKEAPWTWRPGIEGVAYQRLKDLICEPGRAIRHSDPTKPYVLHTDWSKHGMGAVLGQVDDDGNEYIVACVSRSLNKAEREYASYKGEMLGAVFAVKALDYYLRGAKFTLVTDHAPLVYLMTNNNLQGQYARWSLILQEYDFTIKHRPGVKHQNADALSRHPQESAEDNTGSRMDFDKPAAEVAKALLAVASSFRACLAGFINPDEEWQQLYNATPFPTREEQGMEAVGMLSHTLANHPHTDNSLTYTRGDPEAPEPQGRVATCSHAMHELIYDMHTTACSTAVSSTVMDSYGAPTDRYIYGEPEESSASAWEDTALHPERTAGLRRAAYAWVAGCRQFLCTQLRPRTTPQSPSIPVSALENPVDKTTLPAATVNSLQLTGITLYEPFGGLCAGLEMVLRNGIRVNNYLYSDTDRAAQAVMRRRVMQLAELYGSLFPPTAYNHLLDPRNPLPWAPIGPPGGNGRQLPMDVNKITEQDLMDAGALDPKQQWFLVAGWECQDLSPAGSGRGLAGKRSSTYFPLMTILSTLQRLQPNRPPVFILENTAMQVGRHSQKLANDFNTICSQLGDPVLLDAARVGAGAHRLRNYWTNLAHPAHLMTVLNTVHRDPSMSLRQTVLNPGRSPQIAQRADLPPMYPANTCGEELRALPTLMATVDSYAFRNGGHGMVIDDTTGQLVPLTIEERERALGYATGCTDAPELRSTQDGYIRRHQITGRCMDARAMMYLMAVSLAIRAGQHDPTQLPPVDRKFPLTAATARAGALRDHAQSTDHASTLTSSAAMSASSMAVEHTNHQVISTPSTSHQLGGGESSAGTPEQLNFSNFCDSEESYIFRRNVAAAAQADVQESILSVRMGPEMAQPETVESGRREGPAIQKFQSDGPLDHTYAGQAGDEGFQPPMRASDPNYIADVWLDELSLQYIKVGGFTPRNLQQNSREERLRVVRRCKCYFMVSGKLFRRMSNGEAREVPPPAERISVVLDIHNQTGHFGRRRTTHLLMMQYWWSGMYSDVHKVVANCPSCSRVTSSNFGARSPELQPLPIMGMFYRWHVDLAGPFPTTSRGNAYVMVCVEAFSKHAELIPIRSKDADVTAHAFLHNVIARFGACAEVVTDQGKEWDAEFYELLTDCFIDHRRTSANRPQSNGLAERCVQTLKICLRKQINGTKGGADKWDEMVAWIALGYRVTPHTSTKMAPYQMLYAVSPIVPPNIKARMTEPVSFDDPGDAAMKIASRAAAVERSCVKV